MRKNGELPTETPLLSFPCAKCRKKATRGLYIGIYPIPFCDNCEPPQQPSNRLIHAARVFDGNRAHGSRLEAMSLLCEVGERMRGNH